MSTVISVVVPVYNNQHTLDRDLSADPRYPRGSFGDLGLEILFVNDGSTDESWKELLRLKKLYDIKSIC